MYYILTYKTVKHFKEKRIPFREIHLQHATAAVNRGELLLGGALENPTDSALLVFKGGGPLIAEEFAKNDPYVLNGLITEWSVRPWAVVIGTAV